ncbi:hypothetical protein QTP81_00300 [Alteromonas sp. ASW11-36]|uniref:Uncharacterized protein n=1 Tax=Alteromonas arenosi TaxID=3055817 RepID=A0ABT7SSA8_9ALTE|nr:hypothetical protein [Alteromonas sp. ASW11-36]MDM7859041.1 hypothetical protein [Alteromonas sp. ASW11-36]
MIIEELLSADELATIKAEILPLLKEHYFLGTPLEVVAEVSEDIRRIRGYSIHPPFADMVNGMHPKRLL